MQLAAELVRQRTLSPRFFTDEDLVELPPSTRLLFAGLWCLADRDGRLEDRPRRIRVELQLGDVDVDEAINQLSACGKVRRYEVAGVRYLVVRGFPKHQHPHPNEVKSVIPAPAVESNDKQLHATASNEMVLPTQAYTSGSSSTSVKSPNGDSVARRVFVVWQETTNHPQARLLPSRFKLVAARMRDSLDERDLTDCARGVPLDPWPDRVLHNSFEIIFKSAASVEKFRDFYRSGVPTVVKALPENSHDRRIREFGSGMRLLN